MTEIAIGGKVMFVQHSFLFTRLRWCKGIFLGLSETDSNCYVVAKLIVVGNAIRFVGVYTVNKDMVKRGWKNE